MSNFLINSALAAEEIEVGNIIITVDAWWWPHLLFAVGIIKYFFIFFTIVFIAAIILILIRIQGSFKIKIKEAVEEAMEAGKLPKTKTQEEWDAIVSNADSNNQEDYKKAVILAEELFERILKIAGFSGENIEQRLKKISDDQLEFKEDIVWAYKLKNRISSDENFEVDHEEARRAVNIFQKALKKLNIL